MLPVLQTKFSKGHGNCLTACVASILEVPIEVLPEFCTDGEWFDRLYQFCYENGFSLLYWKHSSNIPICVLNAHVIMLLSLEREDELHAVVGKTSLDQVILESTGDKKWSWKTEIVHDPNPNPYPTIKDIVGYILITKA